MSDEWVGRLSDYLDGEMTPAERALLEDKLVHDAELAAVLESLRGVVNRAQTLGDPPPPHAVAIWSGIARGIGATPPQEEKKVVSVTNISTWRSKRLSISVPQLAAAAVVLGLLVGGGSWVIQRSSPVLSESLVAATDGSDDAQVIWASASTTRFDLAVADLETLLETEREFLNPRTVRIVEENLAIIDRAIEGARKALLEDPNSEYLFSHLERTMRQKLTLLQEITTISSAL